ncbi:MAG TPA: RNA polymerase sigma factor [Acidimicrobiales bacterium]|nr:RNA polymerase sigma factor [Acidimicrobiales bacterium]
MALRVEDIDLAADRELVERWQAGEHDAFDDLYRRYFTRLRSYCQRRVGDRDTAEEIAQEAFARALQALPRFAGERRFYPWVTVIANRLCVDHHRRLGRVRPVEEVDPGSVDGDHGTRLALLADIDNLDRALQRLGPRHLEVLELRERRGMSYQQIAEHLDVPQSTVEALLFRARKALRREFFAVAGEGKLASLPLVGALVRRIAGARERIGELLPTISQLSGPVAAGAVAAVLAVGPGAGSGAVAAAAVPTTPNVRSTSAPMLVDAPAPSLVAAAPTAPAWRPAPSAPAPAAPPIERLDGNESAAAARDMPVAVDSGPVVVGVDPAVIADAVLGDITAEEDQ